MSPSSSTWRLLALAAGLAACATTTDPSGGDDTDGGHGSDTDDSTVGKPDLDQDGVPDAWEKAGFYWDGTSFRKWNGEEGVAWFRTDPTRISTDQDPYPDGMEVSGVGLPDSVIPPGNNPLVPAFPNIVAVLVGYEPQLLSTVTLSSGGEVTSGTSLSVSSEQTSSTDKSASTTFGAELGIGGEVDESGVAATFRGKVSGGYGESDAVTEGASTSKATDTTEETRSDWSRATTTSTDAAANLSLHVRYYNVGTDTAYDILPTFNLRIGDEDVATFEPSTQINVLAAGGAYPASVDVVESTSTGDPLRLSMGELALLAGGAPVSLVVDQIDAKVTRREDDGTFTQQSWTGYGGAIGAVSARVVLDDREGASSETLVYADNDASSPPMTIGQALLLSGVTTGTGSALSATLRRADGAEVERDVTSWRLALDDTLWDAIGDDISKPGFNIFDVRLVPGTVVRMHPDPTGASAGIYRVWWEGHRLHVVAVDPVYAAGLLEVAGERSGGGSVAFQFDDTEKAFVSADLGALATRFVDPLEVWVQNPAGVAHDETPARVRVPMAAAFTEGTRTLTLLQDTASEGISGGVISKSFDPETGNLVAMGSNFGFPRGLSLHTMTDGSGWYAQIFAAQAGSTYCTIARPDLDPSTVSSAELDACFWQDANRSVLVAQPNDRRLFPVQVSPASAGTLLAFRYSSTGSTTPDRLAVVRFVQAATGGSAFTTGHVDITWATFKL